METHQKIHIGNLVKQKLKEQQRSVAWLARQVNTDESNLRKILKKPLDINFKLLSQICNIIDYDILLICAETQKNR